MEDSLSLLRQEPFSSALNKFDDLMMESSRAFLFGAGCSKCAGLPLTVELTDKVLRSDFLKDESKNILEEIKANFEGVNFPNIEDYLSELVDLLAIAARRTVRGATKQNLELGKNSYGVAQLENAIKEIKDAIADVLDKPLKIETHWRFMRAVHRPIRPGKSTVNRRIDYLVLNYDTLIEDSLALEKISFADGIEGGVAGWWNAETLSSKNSVVRVLKLHGSINWCQFENDNLPRRIPKTFVDEHFKEKRTLIWPASTKYRETQLDPYAQLMVIARDLLRPKGSSQLVLTICGYKFGDSHINLEIEQALRASKDLTVVIFWSDKDLDVVLSRWNTDKTIQDQVLIFGKRGFWHGSEKALSENELPWWKFEVLTRILEGER
jgi:hypothetical protein